MSDRVMREGMKCPMVTEKEGIVTGRITITGKGIVTEVKGGRVWDLTTQMQRDTGEYRGSGCVLLPGNKCKGVSQSESD